MKQQECRESFRYRSGKDYDAKKASSEAAIVNNEPSKTLQSQAEEADINTIVRRFGVTGLVPTNTRIPLDLDFDGVFDYQTAQNEIRKAQELFMGMPSGVRARFKNNPSDFIAFCEDKSNLEELRKLGLATPAAAEEKTDGQVKGS